MYLYLSRTRQILFLCLFFYIGIVGLFRGYAFEDFSEVSVDQIVANPSLDLWNGVLRSGSWEQLEPYQQTITRGEFEQKLHALFDPFGAMRPYLQFNDDFVIIFPDKTYYFPPYFLNFCSDNTLAVLPPRFFRTPEEFRLISKPKGVPLSGLRIAIDPGHIGGKWAQMEGRSTSYRGSAPVQEGDLNLITAAILKKKLTDLGADVFVVRETTEPVTPHRPEEFIEEARQLLLIHSPALAKQVNGMSIEKQRAFLGQRLTEASELLFYRSSEIAERGLKIKNHFHPDLTVTLYLDATPGSGRGRLCRLNRNIFFIHGCYTAQELEDPKQRLRLIYKILEGSSDVEIEVAKKISDAFERKTHYPPVLYGNSPTTRLVIPGNSYVVARNLAANRNYDGPVVCTEPYFMNQTITYQRLLAGDYDGVKDFGGKSYSSIFQEYASAVLEGLLASYANEEETRL